MYSAHGSFQASREFSYGQLQPIARNFCSRDCFYIKIGCPLHHTCLDPQINVAIKSAPLSLYPSLSFNISH